MGILYQVLSLVGIIATIGVTIWALIESINSAPGKMTGTERTASSWSTAEWIEKVCKVIVYDDEHMSFIRRDEQLAKLNEQIPKLMETPKLTQSEKEDIIYTIDAFKNRYPKIFKSINLTLIKSKYGINI